MSRRIGARALRASICAIVVATVVSLPNSASGSEHGASGVQQSGTSGESSSSDSVIPRGPIPAGTSTSPATPLALSEQDRFASHGDTPSVDQAAVEADGAPFIPGSPCTMDTYCVRERPMPEVFVSIAAGSRHTCGLLADGRTRCWGR